MQRIRRYFVAGLLVWLPLVATYVVLAFAIRLIDRSLLLLPVQYRPETLIGFEIPGLGVILTFGLVLLTGLIVANFFGRRLVTAWEAILSRIPLVRSVYGAVKQITASLFADASQSFREVVLVEYPRRELWMLAFVTGDTPKKFQEEVGEELINIYVPTTPNPTSGFYLMIPPRDIKRLNIPVEVGLKMILSAGVVNPLDDPVEAERLQAELKEQQERREQDESNA
ncbi:MAG: DUF502 domain-containing protein [Pseudomonadota bacterium]